MQKTKIEWTERTWNPISGCTPVGEGCKNCYAKRIHDRFHPGKSFYEVECRPEKLPEPRKVKKPSMIFVNSMSDMFHPDVDQGFINNIFRVMRDCQQHTFLVLTKRADRMLDSVPYDPLPNVWLGVSVEDQHSANLRIPFLLRTRAAVRFVSIEPTLNRVDLNQISVPDAFGRNLHISALHEQHDDCYYSSEVLIDWVICGGETGPRARPIHPDWVRSLRDQCVSADVPFFFKSWGEWAPDCLCSRNKPCRETPRPEPGRGGVMFRCGKKHSGRLLDGREWNEMPEATTQ